MYNIVYQGSDKVRTKITVEMYVILTFTVRIWQQRFSINKCMVSHVGNNRTSPYKYSIQNLALPHVVTAVKDLGVMFDLKLKFNGHINKIVVKALARSNLIIIFFCLVTQPRFFWHL